MKDYGPGAVTNEEFEQHSPGVTNWPTSPRKLTEEELREIERNRWIAWEKANAPTIRKKNAFFAGAGCSAVIASSGMIACSVYAVQLLSGSLNLFPAAYGLLVAAAVFLAILTVVTPLVLSYHGLSIASFLADSDDHSDQAMTHISKATLTTNDNDSQLA